MIYGRGMIYVCPNRGELINEDIIVQCKKCGSNEVEEDGEEFICPSCGGASENGVVFACAICGSESDMVV